MEESHMLTKEEVRSMPAGPGMDLTVAGCILGWNRDGNADTDWWHDPEGEVFEAPLPFSTDVGTAVDRALSKWPGGVELRRAGDEWVCAVSTAARRWEASAATLPLAVSRAMLLAYPDGVRLR
jgi:hypothetical protein